MTLHPTVYLKRESRPQHLKISCAREKSAGVVSTNFPIIRIIIENSPTEKKFVRSQL